MRKEGVAVVLESNKAVGCVGGKAVGLMLALSIATFAADANATTKPVFAPQPTEACVAELQGTSLTRSGHTILDCVGRAAQACMTTPGGDTTVGMMACLEGELRYWDSRLNAAYATRIADATAQDAEMRRIGSANTSLETSLRIMQRAWISFRDKSCLYEQAQWMGGTGGGPATMACHMHETARQALKLEGWWAQ